MFTYNLLNVFTLVIHTCSDPFSFHNCYDPLIHTCNDILTLVMILSGFEHLLSFAFMSSGRYIRYRVHLHEK